MAGYGEARFGQKALLGLTRWIPTTESAVAQVGWELAVRRMFPRKSPAVFCLVNAFSLVEAKRNIQHMVALQEADWLVPDGVGVAALSGIQKTAGADLMLAAARNRLLQTQRHTLLGGFGVAYQAAISQFRETNSTLIEPPFIPTVPPDADMLGMANIVPCDVLWLCMGCPKQESWAILNRSRLRAKVVIAVGAAFDMLAGRTPRAPHWMRGIGLEWAWRIGQEPRRWRRQVDAAVGFLRLCLRGGRR